MSSHPTERPLHRFKVAAQQAKLEADAAPPRPVRMVHRKPAELSERPINVAIRTFGGAIIILGLVALAAQSCTGNIW